MSVLLIDIGNTRIKWALWDAGRLSPQQAHAYAGWGRRDLERHVLAGATAQHSSRVLLSSVGNERLARELARATQRRLGVLPEAARTMRRAAGVRTRYLDPWRLGVDRFLAAIGAHQRAGTRPVCVASIGTALTLDLIDAAGVHRGGAIAPGPELMVRSLLRSTAGIERRAQRGTAARARPRPAAQRSLFARSTHLAIEQGARGAAAALIERAVAQARQELGRAPLLLLTGGAAELVAPYVQRRHVQLPDLVLRGLALYGGLELAD